MNSRGFELQFHWIFVMIAGALIIAFFTSVALNQKDVSVKRIEFEVNSEIEGVLSSAKSGKGAQIIPNPGVVFDCGEACLCTMNDRPLRDIIFFLTGEGETLSLWSKEIALPYRAANVLFVTDPQVKYYFVENELAKNVPVIKSEKGSAAVVNYENKSFGDAFSVIAEHEHTRFVFSRDPGNFQLDDSFKKKSASAVKIAESIVFYEKPEGELFFQRVSEFPRADLASVYAAIFSNNVEVYKCGLQRLSDKIELVSKVYKSRAEALKEHTSVGISDCPGIYDSLIASLGAQEVFAKELAQTLSASAFAGIAQTSRDLEEQNRQLSRNSCPELF